MQSVRLQRRSGVIDLVRADGKVATLTQDGQPDRRITLPRRGNPECLTEELRRLDPDEVYASALTRGLALVSASGRTTTAAKAAASGRAPSMPEERRKAAAATRREARTSAATKKASS